MSIPAAITTFTEVDSNGIEWKVTVLPPTYDQRDIDAASINVPVSKSEKEKAILRGSLGTTREFI